MLTLQILTAIVEKINLKSDHSMEEAINLLPSLKDMIPTIMIVKMNYSGPEIETTWNKSHLQINQIGKEDHWQETFSTSFSGHLVRCVTYKQPHSWKYERNSYVKEMILVCIR